MAEYMETRPYGKPEGLAVRLRAHVRAFGTDKTKPWLGTGIVDDLLCAADVLEGKTAPADVASPITKKVEYDL